jgi:hypothetical protein
MRHWLWLALLTLLLACPWADTSPVQPQAPKLKVPLGGYGTIQSLVPCKGGERTIAIAATTSDQAVLLGLYVYDPHGNCVALDEFTDRIPPSESHRPATDVVVVEWFPPAPGTYAIELRNASPDTCELQMAVR